VPGVPSGKNGKIERAFGELAGLGTFSGKEIRTWFPFALTCHSFSC